MARTEAEVDAVRERWHQLPIPHAEADPDFYLTVVRARSEVERPHVVLAERDGKPSALLAARVEQIRLDTKIGYRTLYRPAVRALTVVHGGVFSANDDRASLGALRQSVERSLRAGEVDVIFLPSVRLNSEVFTELSAIGGRFRQQPFIERRIHRRLELPGSYDEFLATLSRKLRYGVRRDAKKLLAAFPSELRVETLHEPADFERIFRDLVAIADTTYQRALGAAFADTEERRELVRLSLERGWFRAWVLYRRDEPIAFWQGTVFNRVYRSSVTGYKPDYVAHRVGIYLLMQLIEDLCADPEVDFLDYGPGDADYKRQFSTESWEERDLVIFAPTVRGLRINLSRALILGVAKSVKVTLDRLGLTARIKTGWRRRLATERNQ